MSIKPEIDISEVFTNENDDELYFSVESSDESVVIASITGTLLNLLEEGTGSSTISVKADDGMLDVTENLTFTVTETTTVEELSITDVNLYPNPTSGSLTISFGSISVEDNIIVEVIAPIGQNVYNEVFSGNKSKLELDLSMLNNGIYYLRITKDETSVITKQFIINQ